MIEWPYTASTRDLLYTYTAKRRDVLGCTSPTTEGNLEVGGNVQPNASRLEAVYGHSLIINASLGMYQEIHPFRPMSIHSVKINTSLVREAFTKKKAEFYEKVS